MKKIDFVIITLILLLGSAAYASTSMTVEYFGNMGATEAVKRSNLLLAIVNDTCKYVLPMVVGILTTRRNYFLATGIILLIVCNMTMSYMASQGLDLNIANKQLNDKVESSTEFKMNTGKHEAALKTKQSLTEQLISLQGADINSIIENDSTRSMLKGEEATARKKNWISTSYNSKGEVVGRVGAGEWAKRAAKREQEIRLEHQQKIDSVQAQINKQDSVATSAEEGVKGATGGASTEGYHALAEDLGMSVGKLLKIKNIFLELITVLLSSLLGTLLQERHGGLIDKLVGAKNKIKDMKIKDKISSAGNVAVNTAKAVKSKIPFVKAEMETACANDTLEKGSYTFYPNEDGEEKEVKKVNQIGFRATELKDEDLKEYIEYMLNNLNEDGTSIGYVRICKKLNLEKPRKYLETLKTMKILDTDHPEIAGSVVDVDRAEEWLASL